MLMHIVSFKQHSRVQIGCIFSIGKWGVGAEEFAKAKLEIHGIELDPSDPRIRLLMNNSAVYDPVQAGWEEASRDVPTASCRPRYPNIFYTVHSDSSATTALPES